MPYVLLGANSQEKYQQLETIGILKAKSDKGGPPTAMPYEIELSIWKYLMENREAFLHGYVAERPPRMPPNSWPP